MSIRHRAARAGFAVALAAGSVLVLARQGPAPPESIELDALHWRRLGPLAGGETTGITGDSADPRLLYAGSPGGGLWTTTDYGHAWRPIFDDQPTGVVDAVAAAPSDSRVVYAGTGPAPGGLDQPDGAALYASADRGASWARTGFQTTGRIARISVDPADSRRLIVGVLSSAEPGGLAGLYRSRDGGRTFELVLNGNQATGRLEAAFDPRDPSTVYAARWQTPSTDAASSALSSAIFRSSDEGATWQPIAALPGLADGLGVVTLAVSPARAGRVFASVGARSRAGLYRSDDRGATWTVVSDDPRLTGAALAADPVDADRLYAAGREALRSTDGGRTWAGWHSSRGASYRAIWIHPTQPAVAALASTAGVFVTVNGGETWSGGGPPAAAFTQIETDHAFPSRVCGGQPDGGVVCVSSRGGAASAERLGGRLDRAGYVAIDPTDADVLYLGELRRYDRRSGQSVDIAPPGRPASSPDAAAPLIFPTVNPRALYFAGNGLWTSSTGGQQWTRIGPTLADPSPASSGDGVEAISALSVSSIDGRVLWIGTDRGHVHLTRDRGATWTDVTPPAGAGPVSTITGLQASFFDTNTVYAVLRDPRTGGSRLMRSRTAGSSWADLSGGLPPGAVHVVREDSGRRGLLFAAGDRSVWLSFDDGDSWQPLRLNLPPAPVRDLEVVDSDLIAATEGRGLWMLDDITPLRQITADVWRAPAFLFRPPIAWRSSAAARDQGGADAAGVDPVPDGVAITYSLGADASSVAVEIVDGPAGEIVRRYPAGLADSPPATQGLHRITWDLRYTPPAVDWIDGHRGDPLPGRWALPGTYQIRLIRGQSTLRQAVLVRIDPRVKATAADLEVQARLTREVDERLAELAASYGRVRERQSSLLPGPASGAATDLMDLIQTAGGRLRDLFVILQSADARPTEAAETAVNAALEDAARLVEQAR